MRRLRSLGTSGRLLRALDPQEERHLFSSSPWWQRIDMVVACRRMVLGVKLVNQ